MSNPSFNPSCLACKVVVELTDLSCTADIVCAGRVLANKRNRLYFDEEVEEFISEETRKEMGKMDEVRPGDWVGFNPKQAIGLEGIAQKVVRLARDRAIAQAQ